LKCIELFNLVLEARTIHHGFQSVKAVSAAFDMLSIIWKSTRSRDYLKDSGVALCLRNVRWLRFWKSYFNIKISETCLLRNICIFSKYSKIVGSIRVLILYR
jgi:hypothetical protein